MKGLRTSNILTLGERSNSIETEGTKPRKLGAPCEMLRGLCCAAVDVTRWSRGESALIKGF